MPYVLYVLYVFSHLTVIGQFLATYDSIVELA